MVEASLVNIVETLGILIGVAIAVYELRNISKTRRLETLTKHQELHLANDIATKWYDVAYTQKFVSYEEWQEKYGPSVNPEAYRNLQAALNFGNTFGVILKEGLIEPDILYQFWPPFSNLAVWRKAEPVVKVWRERYNDPSLYASFEYLVEDTKRRYPEVIFR
jgi:hypothetical protein